MAASDIALVLLRRLPVFETVIPSKLLEAFAAGAPVILGVQGEAKRILEESAGGIAITPEDSQALEEALLKLATSPEERESLGRAGRLYVEREFDRRLWAQRYLDVLGQIGRSPDQGAPHP
jgi:glycosyltransferase involved in cell wall biosynthesis